MQFVEIPLLGQGGVARSAGVVRNGDSTTRLGALYFCINIFIYHLFVDKLRASSWIAQSSCYAGYAEVIPFYNE